MSYNGIGLVTPRGSGTSGYVQRNLAALKTTKNNLLKKRDALLNLKSIPVRKPNKKILEHRRKRQIEVHCLRLKLDLKKKKCSVEEISSKIKKLREKIKYSTLEELEGENKQETHAVLKAQRERNKRLKRALNIKEDHKIGDAFRFEEMREKKKQEKSSRTLEDRLRTKRYHRLSRNK